MSEQEKNLAEMLKGFVTVDGEFEFEPYMIDSSMGLCLDFVDYLKAQAPINPYAKELLEVELKVSA